MEEERNVPCYVRIHRYFEWFDRNPSVKARFDVTAPRASPRSGCRYSGDRCARDQTTITTTTTSRETKFEANEEDRRCKKETNLVSSEVLAGFLCPTRSRARLKRRSRPQGYFTASIRKYLSLSPSSRTRKNAPSLLPRSVRETFLSLYLYLSHSSSSRTIPAKKEFVFCSHRVRVSNLVSEEEKPAAMHGGDRRNLGPAILASNFLVSLLAAVSWRIPSFTSLYPT